MIHTKILTLWWQIGNVCLAQENWRNIWWMSMYAWLNEYICDLIMNLCPPSHHCDLIDFLKSVASDFGRSVLRVSALWLQPGHCYSTLWQCQDASQPPCFIIDQTWRPGRSYLHLSTGGRVRGLRLYLLVGYSRQWHVLKHSSHDPLVAIWQWSVLCSKEGGRQGPQGYTAK